MEKEILSSCILAVKKAKLLTILPSIKFVDENDVKPYRCGKCGEVVIYHHVATCEHLFCGKCRGVYAHNACPIDNCSNESINKVYQRMDIELGVNNLKVHCIYKGNGCEEIVTLSEILDHTSKCKLALPELQSKIWNPNVNQREFDELIGDLLAIRKTVVGPREKKPTRNSEIEESITREEIEQLKNNVEEKLNNVKSDFLVDVTLHLGSKLERQFHELETKLRKEANEEKLSLALEIQASLTEKSREMKQDLEESTEQMRLKLEQNLANLHQENSELLKALEAQAQKTVHELEDKLTQEIKDEQISIDSNVKLTLSEYCGALDNKFKKSLQHVEHKLGERIIDVQHDISSTNSNLKRSFKRVFGDDNIATKESETLISLEPFSLAAKVEVQNKHVSGIFQYLVKQNYPEFTWKIYNVASKLRDLISGKVDVIQSDYIKVIGSDLEVCATLSYHSETKTLGLVYDKWVVSYETRFTQYFKHYEFHQGKIRLMDQSDNCPKKNVWRVHDHPFGSLPESSYLGGCHHNIPLKFLEDPHSIYIKDDSALIKIQIVPYSMLHKYFCSNNGAMVWEINLFSEIKRDGINGVWHDIHSDEFYTMEQGYRMQILIRFMENHLMFYQSCIKGEFDENLSPEFPHRINMVIFDQSESKEKVHLVRTVECTTVKYIEIFQLTYAEIENPRYLHNDCLKIKFVVEHT